MFCRECGSQLQPESRFCHSCGERVEPRPPVAPQPAFDEAKEQPAAAAAPASVTTPPPAEPVPVETVALPVSGARGAEILRQAVQADMTGDIEHAVTLAEEATRVDPASASARSCLAGLYERLGRREDAISQYEASISLDPSNQLDMLRLRRLAPERAALLSARAPRSRPRRWVAGAIAAACFLVVVGSSTAAYWFLGPPHRSGLAAGQTVAQVDPAILIARARGQILMGEPARAESLALEALTADPTNADAQAVLAEARSRMGSGKSAESQARAESGLPGLVFPGAAGPQAQGAAFGLAEGLAAGLPLAAPGTGIPPAVGTSATQPGAQPGAPPVGPYAPGVGGLLPGAGPNTVTPGDRIPPVDGGGGLLGNIGGGMSNVFGPGPSTGGGPLRRPGGGGATGGVTPPTGGGGGAPSGAGGDGPIPPPTGNSDGGPSIRRAPEGPSVRIAGATAPGSGGGGKLSIKPSNPDGGSIRPGGGSGSGSGSAWDLQQKAVGAEANGDLTGAHRYYGEAKEAYQREGGAAAAAAIGTCDRGMKRTAGG